LIAHPVRAREPPKAKKSKIGVARKPDLITKGKITKKTALIIRLNKKNV
jgi:hypothetical protein